MNCYVCDCDMADMRGMGPEVAFPSAWSSGRLPVAQSLPMPNVEEGGGWWVHITYNYVAGDLCVYASLGLHPLPHPLLLSVNA